MLRFTLRQLEYFIAVGEAGNISVAAERIAISPPSISSAIAHLEAELGAKLFLRHHARGLSLTPFGEALLKEARQLVDQANQLNAVATEITGAVRGRINVGCFITFAPMLMPELAHSFTARFPATTVFHFVSDHQALMRALVSNRIDIALTYDLGTLPPGIIFAPLASLPPQAIFGEMHPMAGRASVTLEELAREDLILLDLPGSRDYFLGLFRQARLEPKTTLQSSYPDVIRTMVANHHGYTIVNVIPRTDLALDGRRVVRVPLAGECPPTVIGVARHGDQQDSNLVQTFAKHCAELISDASIPGMIAPAVRSENAGAKIPH